VWKPARLERELHARKRQRLAGQGTRSALRNRSSSGSALGSSAAIAWFSSVPPGRKQVEQPLRVHVDLCFADMLGHADARDRVEGALRQLAVVLDADLDLLAQACLSDALRALAPPVGPTA